MSRIMAIDYGKKRSGIAVTDPEQIIANGLTTVPTAQLLQYVKSYVEKEPVECFVVGKPLQMSGKPSENGMRASAFVKKLQSEFPAITVKEYDERFTSVLAHRAMLDGGLRKTARQDKALVDEISATIILQSYMESLRQGTII
ncbi:MAG TPA: Holliday junction resolvase RuvX [Prevotellaceae bacterium]|nr:Holliday junction resolvase RuvX [Prevotellaceae bacterium]